MNKMIMLLLIGLSYSEFIGCNDNSCSSSLVDCLSDYVCKVKNNYSTNNNNIYLSPSSSQTYAIENNDILLNIQLNMKNDFVFKISTSVILNFKNLEV
jgi:hypothetical protein